MRYLFKPTSVWSDISPVESSDFSGMYPCGIIITSYINVTFHNSYYYFLNLYTNLTPQKHKGFHSISLFSHLRSKCLRTYFLNAIFPKAANKQTVTDCGTLKSCL